MTVLAGAAEASGLRSLAAGGRQGAEPGFTPGGAEGGREPLEAGFDLAAHLPAIRAPRSAVGSLVPVFVSVPLPMAADHYIRSLEIAVPSDPVPSKGRVWLTPACGEAYFYTQARADEGKVELAATAECTRHGRFESRVAIEVLEGG